ncbi:hypothetical protein HNR50_002013 [Spirochaeta isovalerica]|uniref:Uncharacterized protein n=1 Tax=Spirochaeta isovalerica TaxID=150 RepID=A0A841RBG0_9SPIO|nr:hypothetical protein [Spirochaeta isovalerica]
MSISTGLRDVAALLCASNGQGNGEFAALILQVTL